MSISSMPEHPRLQKGAHQRAAAGARLAFDAATLGEVVSLLEKTIGELESHL